MIALGFLISVRINYRIRQLKRNRRPKMSFSKDAFNTSKATLFRIKHQIDLIEGN
ncbi:hypothetical protein QY895_11900 [Latilactobacillus sakei]